MTKNHKKPKVAMAFHGKSKNGTSVVGIGNLRVVIVQDDNSWFAQGLEIDYAVQGKTIEDAKKQFEDGLSATIDEHLKIFGTIEKLLKIAPQEVWKEMYLEAAISKHYRYTQVSVHHFKETLMKSLPFSGIEYLTRTPIEQNL